MWCGWCYSKKTVKMCVLSHMLFQPWSQCYFSLLQLFFTVISYTQQIRQSCWSAYTFFILVISCPLSGWCKNCLQDPHDHMPVMIITVFDVIQHDVGCCVVVSSSLSLLLLLLLLLLPLPLPLLLPQQQAAAAAAAAAACLFYRQHLKLRLCHNGCRG